MKTIPTNLAFPLVALGVAEEIGLTKREWFAGMAMEGHLGGDALLRAQIIKNALMQNVVPPLSRERQSVVVARYAVECADALIAELNKET